VSREQGVGKGSGGEKRTERLTGKEKVGKEGGIQRGVEKSRTKAVVEGQQLAQGESKGGAKKGRKNREASEAEGSEAEGEARNKKAIAHRDGGRMTTSNTRPRGGKKFKSSSVVNSEEEVDTKGKRKAAAKAQERVKEVAVQEESEEEDEEDEDGEDEDDAADKKTVLEQVKARGEKEIPYGYTAVDDKCGQCTKAGVKCYWAPGAVNKPGPKACLRCNKRKTGCTPKFRSSSALLVDLGTPLEEDLIKRFVPPPSASEGIPRAGIEGETSSVPTTLGELLVDILTTVRATQEENRALRKEVDIIHNTLGTTVSYDTKQHSEVMEALQRLPAVLEKKVKDAVEPLPAAIDKRLMVSIEAAAAVRFDTPPPNIPVSKPTIVIPARVATSPSHHPSAQSSPLTPSPDVVTVRQDLPDADSDGGARDPATSVSPNGLRPRSLPPSSPSGAANVEEGNAVPSVVANRTRTKTKVVTTPEGPDEEDGSASEVGEGSSRKIVKSNKRKESTPDGDEEGEGARKKAKATPKAKAPARKPKAAGKKKP